MRELAAKHHISPRSRPTRELLRSILRLAPVWIAVLAADPAYGGSPPTRACSPLFDSPQSLWAAADFDGDKSVDLARVEVGSAGTVVDQSAVDLFAFCKNSAPPIFRSFPKAGLVLSVRDVDEDHDSDLVLRDAFAGEALYIWLNDGTGRFSETEPSGFPGAGDDPLSLARRVLSVPQPAVFPPSQTYCSVPRTAGLVPFVPASAHRAQESSTHIASRCRHAGQSRAPPSLSF